MNKRDARKIAETITNEQIQEMFDRAKTSIKEWTAVSVVNGGLTKGVAWNILASDFDVTQEYTGLAKTNMVREFGDYLPYELMPEKKSRKKSKKTLTHEAPVF